MNVELAYSAALRQVGGDHALAKDVVQTVFMDLARKAGSLSGSLLLSGRLYTSTQFATMPN
jgi:DNA-directed RNA polymerase specialized sigma24 family protein